MTNPAAQEATEAALTDGGLRSALRAGGVREVSLLAWPVVLQMSAETLLQLINSAMVGRLGATELGAVGFGGIWMWTLVVAFFGGSTGVQVFAARADGAGRQRECGPWIWYAFYALVPASVVWTALIWLTFPLLLTLIGPSPELQSQSLLYVSARLPGIPVIVIGAILTSFLRGLGDTRTPMFAMLASLVAHVGCAYALIFGKLGMPAWGIAGAGVAIVVAEVVYAVVLGAAVFSRGMRQRYATSPTRGSRSQMLRFLHTSAPIGGQWLLDMTSFALFTSIVARMGDVEMAASQAMLQLLSLSFMQAAAIGVASGTLVSRYIGAHQLDAAEASYHSAVKLVLILATVVAALFLGVPEVLMRIFTTDPTVLDLARPLLLLGAAFQVVDALGIVAGGSLRGGGDTRWPFVVQATLAWALRLPLVYLGAVVLGGGLLGAWMGELGYVAVLAATFTLRFRSGRWRTIQI